MRAVYSNRCGPSQSLLLIKTTFREQLDRNSGEFERLVQFVSPQAEAQLMFGEYQHEIGSLMLEARRGGGKAFAMHSACYIPFSGKPLRGASDLTCATNWTPRTWPRKHASRSCNISAHSAGKPR